MKKILMNVSLGTNRISVIDRELDLNIVHLVKLGVLNGPKGPGGGGRGGAQDPRRGPGSAWPGRAAGRAVLRRPGRSERKAPRKAHQTLPPSHDCLEDLF